jgi:uncharacterized protein (TIGR03437 family)
MKLLPQITIAAAFGAALLTGQSLDNSGNSLLHGTFMFRHVAITAFDQSNNIMTARAEYGAITFDGQGNYTLSGTYVDTSVSGGQPQAFTVSNGTYSIGANGFGFIANPLAPSDNTNTIFGAVAQGIFSGSATEGTLNDIFVAIPAAATPPANASFSGAYWAGLIDFPSGTDAALKNALFKLSPDGKGAFGNISLSGQAANQNGTLTQTVTGATYSFGSDGSATLTIPAPTGVPPANALFNGTKTMYLSADGNFLLAFSPGGFDIVTGVRALSAPATPSIFQGTYFLAGLEDSPSFNGVDSFYGSALDAQGDGNEIVHQRVTSPRYYPYDYEVDDQTTINSDGTATDFNGYKFAFGNGGKAFVGIGTGGFFSLVVGAHSSEIMESGPVVLSPIGVTNAASYAPITMSIAPGELLTLFGSGLSSATLTTQGGQPFPTTLGGVQVLINGIACPIYYVSPTQVSAIVPYAFGSNNQSVGNVQVDNNGTMSNAVSMFVSDSAPGIFTQTQNGLGYAAALHSDYSLVTPSNPAKPGDYLQIFLTGLGTVTPAIMDGGLGSSDANSLNKADLFTSSNLLVYFDDYNNQQFPQATVSYAGLAPGLAGLYQLNVQVPTGVGPGDVYVEVATDAADVIQVLVPVGSATSTAAPSGARPTRAVTQRASPRRLHRPLGARRRPQPPAGR